MASEVVVSCDVCGRVVSDVMADDEHGTWHRQGRGYTEHKRSLWDTSSRWLGWRRCDDGIQIVCDYCWDAVRELRASALASLSPVEGER